MRVRARTGAGIRSAVYTAVRSIVAADGTTRPDAVVVRARSVLPAPIGALRGGCFESSAQPVVVRVRLRVRVRVLA